MCALVIHCSLSLENVRLHALNTFLQPYGPAKNACGPEKSIQVNNRNSFLAANFLFLLNEL